MTTPIASEVEAGFRAIRAKTSTNLVAPDITSVGSENIIRGQGNPYIREWRGPTGVMAWSFIDGEDRRDWAWTTAMVKTANSNITSPPDPHTEYAVLTQKSYQDIWGCGKRIYLDETAQVHIHLTAEVISPKLNQWGVNYRMPGYTGKTASRVYLEVDGAIKDELLGYSWEESEGLPPSGEPSHGITSSLNNPADEWMRRYYAVFYDVEWDAGWHTVRLVIDCRNERTYVSRRGVQVEAVYATQ